MNRTHFHTQFRMNTFLVALLVAVLAPSMLTQTVSAQNDDATAMLEKASRVMLELDSFHFVISTPVGKTMLIDEIELEQIEGDVLRPATFHATFTVSLPLVSIHLDAVGHNDKLWVSNPLTGGDDLVLVASAESGDPIPPELILNPDQLVLQAISLLRGPVIAGTEEIDGTVTTRIDGVFDPTDIGVLGTPVSEAGLGDFPPLDVSVWLDEEDRVVRAEFAGALLPTEEAGTEVVRRVDLSAFDEPVEIDIPDAES